MSKGNVEAFGRMVDAWNRGDVHGFMAVCADDIEVVFPPDVPEPGPFRGAAEVRAWVEGFLSAWDTHRVEADEVIDHGEEVVAMLRLSGRGAASGIELHERDAHVYWFRDGRVVRWVNYATRAEALEAVGLSE